MAGSATHDRNLVPAVIAESSDGLGTVIPLWADPITHALLTSGSSGTQVVAGNVADAATDSGNPVKVGGKYNLTLPTYTDGQRADLQLSNRGNLRVELYAGANGYTMLADNADAVVTSSTVNKIPVIGRNTVYNGTTWDRMPGTTTGVSVVPKPTTTGGYTIYRNISLLATGISVKGSAGQVYGWYIANNASSVRYVKFYNKATAGTVGTDTPVLTIPVPANGAANIEFQTGIAFSLGISVGATTGIADSDVAAPTANDCVVNLLYS
jgi:hypothetical protein